MAGQIPSEGRGKVIIDEFSGVNDAFADDILPKGLVRFSVGLKDITGKCLARLDGSLPLFTCSSSHPGVLDLRQLDFASSSFVLVHSCATTVGGKRELQDGFDVNPSPEIPNGILEYGI